MPEPISIREALDRGAQALGSLYSPGESGAILSLVIEQLTGLSPARIRIEASAGTGDQQSRPIPVADFEQILQRLLRDEPVQYILGEAWFAGMRFTVSPAVLIPRPETEELVEWVIDCCRFPVTGMKILDVGTGSGCIPVALKKRLPDAVITGIDLSEQALEVARLNSSRLEQPVSFRQMDFLEESSRNRLGRYDVITSNPPYIPEAEAAGLPRNVTAYEPGMALFVPDQDPLIFYRALGAFAKSKLKPDGALFAEIHEDLGPEVVELFASEGLQAELRNDLQGKNRMIRVLKQKDR